MRADTARQLSLFHAFASGAPRYWIGVFPQVAREVRRWRERAAAIPDPVLRRLALLTHRSERGNLEGAAAFAMLAPRGRRRAVVRASVAFQALYDYVDTLAEQPSRDPLANGHQLHLPLLAALDQRVDLADPYHYFPSSRDGDYVRAMVAACRDGCSELPCYRQARPAMLRAARRMVSYQAFTHNLEEQALARWAAGIAPGDRLAWWEAAAGAASSLGVFALLASAAGEGCGEDAMARVEEAYFPWVGALHVLLDSFADRAIDLDSGHHSLVGHYADEAQEAERLGAIAARAIEALDGLPRGPAHGAILAAMIGFYLSAPGAQIAASSLTRATVLERLGTLGPPVMAVLSARRAAAKLLAG